MKYKNELGEWVTINVRALDSLPVGTELEYDGTDIPVGWEQIDDVIYANDFKCKNLFDKGVVSAGYLSDAGNLVSNSTFSTSNYIEVSGNSKITVSGNSGSSENICFYDSSKTFVSFISMGTNTQLTVNVPSNAKYVRVTIKNTNLDTTQIEIGNEATTYTPYKNFDSTIKSMQISGTTSANGNLGSTLNKNTTVILGVSADNNNAIPTFYAIPSSDYWTVHFMQVGSGNALASTQISGTLYYIDFGS